MKSLPASLVYHFLFPYWDIGSIVPSIGFEWR